MTQYYWEPWFQNQIYLKFTEFHIIFFHNSRKSYKINIIYIRIYAQWITILQHVKQVLHIKTCMKVEHLLIIKTSLQLSYSENICMNSFFFFICKTLFKLYVDLKEFYWIISDFIIFVYTVDIVRHKKHNLFSKYYNTTIMS